MITARSLAAMKPGEWAADPAAKGAGRLQARKLSGGQIAFYYRYTAPDGTRPRMPLGTGLTLAAAREQAGSLSRRYQAGDKDLKGALESDERAALILAQEERASAEAKSSATLGALLTAYSDDLRAGGKITAKETEQALLLHVKLPWPTLWNKPAADVTLDDLLLVIAKIVKAEKLRQAGKVRSYLRAAYAAAIKARQRATSSDAMRSLQITTNPAHDLATVEGGNNAKDRALSITELRAYWARIQDETGSDARLAMLRFHLLTGGQRIAQLARLTTKSFDADSASITVLDRKGRRQRARDHFVPLIQGATESMGIMRGKELGDFLFTCSHGVAPATYDVFRGAMDDVVARMKDAKELEGCPFTPGDIRRTVETRLAAAGQNRDLRAQLQSHGISGVQDRHYDRHDYLKEKRDALKLLHELLVGKTATVTQIRKKRAG